MIKPPAIRIHPSTTYQNQRLLPGDAEVIVRVGDSVHPDTPIARVVSPVPPVEVPVASALGVRPKDLAAYLVKQVGDQVRQGEIIARKKASLLQGKKECSSPIEGTLEYVSYEAGNVTIRRPGRPTVVWAEAIGRVSEIVSNRSVMIETRAGVVQGVFGIGTEVQGQLKVLTGNPDEKISADQVDQSCRGCVLVGGGIEEDAVLARTEEMGAVGLILGSVSAAGHETWMVSGKNFPVTVILTDGFGASGMFPAAFDALRRNKGKPTWLQPSHAGKAVAVVLLADEPTREEPTLPLLATGTMVRITRAPHFGQSGRVAGLPGVPRLLENGARTLVAEIELADKKRIVVPIANLELIG